jgi:hypothetical protein
MTSRLLAAFLGASGRTRTKAPDMPRAGGDLRPPENDVEPFAGRRVYGARLHEARLAEPMLFGVLMRR